MLGTIQALDAKSRGEIAWPNHTHAFVHLSPMNMPGLAHDFSFGADCEWKTFLLATA